MENQSLSAARAIALALAKLTSDTEICTCSDYIAVDLKFIKAFSVKFHTALREGYPEWVNQSWFTHCEPGLRLLRQFRSLYSLLRQFRSLRVVCSFPVDPFCQEQELYLWLWQQRHGALPPTSVDQQAELELLKHSKLWSFRFPACISCGAGSCIKNSG